MFAVSVIFVLMRKASGIIEMEVQRLRAQAASRFGVDYNNVIRVEGTTTFEGYTEAETQAKSYRTFL